MTIFNRKDDRDIQGITLKGSELKRVRSFKYLGVDICEDLNMDEYVKNVK